MKALTAIALWAFFLTIFFFLLARAYSYEQQGFGACQKYPAPEAKCARR